MIRSFGSSHKQTIYDNAVEVYEKIFNVKLDQNNKKALILALSTLKYGQIYPISRSEAKTAILSRGWLKIKDQIEYFEGILKESKSNNLILNQAIAKTISESKNRHIVYQDLVAPFSYCSIKAGDIVHRANDFESQFDFDFVDEPKYDLHDEGHFVMGHIDERFGYKLQSPFNKTSFTDIPTLRYLLDGKAGINHNFFFNKIGYSSFYNFLFLEKGLDSKSLIIENESFVEAISNEVYNYLTTGQFVDYDISKSNFCDLTQAHDEVLKLNVGAKELAALTQIMFSEAGSSEVGEEFYTRGSPSGLRSKYEYDLLLNLNAVEKIQLVASLFEAKTESGDSLRLHHENRSTLRIRGILIGYLNYAETLIQTTIDPKDAFILRLTIKQIRGVYLNNSKQKINLFEKLKNTYGI
jgi:hypothetical protein